MQGRRFRTLGCLVLLWPTMYSIAADRCVAPELQPVPCAATDTELRRQLDQIIAAHKADPARTSIKQLVAWDAQLRHLLTDRYQCRFDGNDADIARNQDAAIGISVEHWTDLLYYNGKLLAEAHARNPHSALRSNTLYATVESPAQLGGSADPLNAAAARRYLAEFPHGPFARESALYLADLDKDIFMALRDGRVKADYHYDCVAPYFGSDSHVRRMHRAQQQAMHYYQRAYAIRPSSAEQAYYLCQMTAGTIDTWSYCPD
jgi:hypothetical protein